MHVPRSHPGCLLIVVELESAAELSNGGQTLTHHITPCPYSYHTLLFFMDPLLGLIIPVCFLTAYLTKFVHFLLNRFAWVGVGGGGGGGEGLGIWTDAGSLFFIRKHNCMPLYVYVLDADGFCVEYLALAIIQGACFHFLVIISNHYWYSDQIQGLHESVRNWISLCDYITYASLVTLQPTNSLNINN